jgi:hypothetical protein
VTKKIIIFLKKKGESVTYDGFWKLEYLRTEFASAGNKRLFKLMPHLSHEAPNFTPPGCVAEGKQHTLKGARQVASCDVNMT